MKKDCYSISIDDSNDQGLNPVTVKLFNINQHMVVNQLLEMHLSSSSDPDGIFAAIDKAFANTGIPWHKCISLGVDNTSVSIGKHHSLITKARERNDEIILMGCPCHMAHNTTYHATKALEKLVIFNAEELLLNLYFHFDYSSKRKNLREFCAFCDQDFYKILKFHSTRWLGLSTCREKTLKTYPSLKSYFSSQNSEIKDGERTVSRLNRLIDAIGHVIPEVDVFLFSVFSIDLHHNTNSFNRVFHPVNSYFNSSWPF